MNKPRKQRRYAPFVKQGKRWIRVLQPDGTPRAAYPLPKASQIYQDWLLGYAMWGDGGERQLRPVKPE